MSKLYFSKDWLMNSYAKYHHLKRVEVVKELCRDLNPASVLDYGCNDGTMACDVWRPEIITGYDVDDYSGYVPSGMKFTTDRPVGNKFDVIFCHHVLEHINDWDPVFEYFRKIAGISTKLIIGLPLEDTKPPVKDWHCHFFNYQTALNTLSIYMEVEKWRVVGLNHTLKVFGKTIEYHEQIYLDKDLYEKAHIYSQGHPELGDSFLAIGKIKS